MQTLSLAVILLLVSLTCQAQTAVSQTSESGPGETISEAAGKIEVAFVFGSPEGFQPSYQTALWLQDTKGQYVKSLFVSEYLAYGGFNDPTICPDWIKVANWDKATEADYDAVSRPTPPVGENALSINLKDKGIPPGTYEYLLEVHLVEKFNILCKGQIEIGNQAAESKPEVSYLPDKYPEAEGVVSSVAVKYLPAQPAPQNQTTKER